MKIFLFLKQKKIVFFTILLFIGIGMIVPIVAHAAADWLDIAVAWEKGFFSDVKAPLQAAAMSVILGAGELMVSITFFLMGLGQIILNAVVKSSFIQESITGDSTVIKGWTVVRDFSNMFIVLGFVVIGLATILRIREYEAQKLLPKLIIIALLINFSLLICGIIIDGTNITMNYFLSGAVVQGATTITGTISDAVKTTDIYTKMKFALGNDPPDWNAFASIAVSSSLYAGIAGMLFIIYALLFIFRYVALMCLVILSPLAFVCSVFPRTKAIYDKWLTQFIQWAGIGIPAMFFIWLGSQVAITTFKPPAGEGAVNIYMNPMAFFIPVAFMYFAYTLTFQITVIGAAGAIGAATGVMGFAAGAGKRVGGGAARLAANATGATRAGQYIGDKATRIGEGLGLVARGTSANRQTGRLEEARKRVGNMTDSELVSLAKKKGFTAQERLNSAAATEKLLKKGDGHLLEDKLESSVKRAKGYGANFGDLKKGEYRAAGFDEPAIKRLTDRGMSRPDAIRAVVQQQLEENLSSMSGNQRRNIDPAHITPELLASNSMNPSIIRNFRTADDPQLLRFGDRITHTIDPGVDAEFATRIAAAIAVGNNRERDRLRILRNEILNLLS